MPAILHCFDWHLNNVKNNLKNIKESGFDIIQLSPLQPQKSPQKANWKNQWWKLYQPLGFQVAKNNENVLGNKDDLVSLCTEADKYDIKIIVDVVANHLASEERSKTDHYLSSAVRDYEPYIYDNNLIHHTGFTTDNDVIRGDMGLVDLQTENSYIQGRVQSLLKEYVDLGVDGFRFDAAKHIETEYDTEEYKSDFWKNTLDVAKEYYKGKTGDELFAYGEILGNPGQGRSFSYYTGRMKVTDSDQSSEYLAAARGSTSKIDEDYDSEVAPSKLVIWGESHDTYSNDWGESKDDDLETVQKAYFMQASRRNASVLYFARPNDDTVIGDIGNTNYLNKEIKAINAFHNYYGTSAEQISTNNGFFINIRKDNGAALLRVRRSETTVDVTGLKDGTYKDVISNNTYTVSNGSVTLGSQDYYVLIDANEDIDITVPTVELNYQSTYSNTQNVTVNASGARTITYKINNGAETTLTGNTITLPTSLSNGLVTLTVKASNKIGETSKTIQMIKTNTLVGKQLIVYNIDNSYKYFIWAWKDGSDGSWLTPTTDTGNLIGLDMGQSNMFIIVKFASDVTTPDWNKKINQTENIRFDHQFYNYSDLNISNS